MRTRFLALALIALAACSAEARRQRQVRDCSTVNTQADLIALCLTTEFRWKDAAAAAAGKARERQLDSLRAAQADSLWRLDDARHRAEVRQCPATAGEVSECLQLRFGWPTARAVATADSLWRRDGERHRGQVRDCVRRGRGSNIGACLMLHYRWPSPRALAADDSVRRAQAR